MSVFVVLGLLWAAVLVPPVLRARAERRAEFIDSFSRQMGALGKKAGAGGAAGVHAAPVSGGARPSAHSGVGPVSLLARPTNPAKRRRDILGGLVGAMLGAFLLGLVPALRSVWILLLFLVNLSLGYIALLAHNQRHAHRARVAASRVPQPAGLSPALDAWR